MHDESSARAILSALTIPFDSIAPVGTGFASDAWLVSAGERRSVLRVAGAAAEDSTYEMEHALMARLGAAGSPVPEPIAGDWELADWAGPAFSLTSWVPGDPLRPEARGRAAPLIAEFLRTMHAVRLAGFGPLALVDGELRGSDADLEAGLRTWAIRPLWPLGGARLDAHPALRDAPGLARRLDARAARVREGLFRGPHGTLHSDLHEENTLDADGILSVIDFGEALVGPIAWEFATLAYFVDWSFADRVLETYLAGTDPARWRADATAIALCFGVYRWQQDRLLGLDEDAHDAGFLEETLDRLAGAA